MRLDQKVNIPVSSGHAGNKARSQIISQDPLTLLLTGLGKKRAGFTFYFGPVDIICGTDFISTFPLELSSIQKHLFKRLQ